MRTIAVIDDNPSMLQGLNRLLSAHGLRVQTFASAEAFLDAYVECEADCLLLDIHLAGI
jgi:FixJ family two-component response regulator